jgi:hypothetical protein
MIKCVNLIFLTIKLTLTMFLYKSYNTFHVLYNYVLYEIPLERQVSADLYPSCSSICPLLRSFPKSDLIAI